MDRFSIVLFALLLLDPKTLLQLSGILSLGMSWFILIQNDGDNRFFAQLWRSQVVSVLAAPIFMYTFFELPLLGGILIGASRFVSAEFSFFLGIPTMFGASLLKIVKFITSGNSFDMNGIVILLVGTVVSFIVSIIAIKFLMNYIKKNDFTAFGWYRIVLGIILIGYWAFMM